MRRYEFVTVAITALFAGQSLGGGPAEGRTETESAAPTTGLQTVEFPITSRPQYYGRVLDTQADGEVRLQGATDSIVSEGYYLAWVRPKLLASHIWYLSRVQVLEVHEKGLVAVRFPKDAVGKFNPGILVQLYRPAGATTSQLKLVPSWTRLIDATTESHLVVSEPKKFAQSLTNLKDIGKGLLNYHQHYGRFPPAVVYGPDSKPWHSWRVLLLPFLGYEKLFDKYKLDEPWDGPNNKALAKEMPKLFSDPIYATNGKYDTHYAVVTGLHTVFHPEGIKFDGTASDLFSLLKDDRARQIEDIRLWGIKSITDGTSYTIAVGLTGPDQKIPWMKPVDLKYDDKFPGLGKPGGFAAPYRTPDGAHRFGAFLMFDGETRTIAHDIKIETLRDLINRHDGRITLHIPGLEPTHQPVPTGQIQVRTIELLRDKNGVVARLVFKVKASRFRLLP